VLGSEVWTPEGDGVGGTGMGSEFAEPGAEGNAGERRARKKGGEVTEFGVVVVSFFLKLLDCEF
jgi:nitrous oxide reductase accessory protein NosL